MRAAQTSFWLLGLEIFTILACGGCIWLVKNNHRMVRKLERMIEEKLPQDKEKQAFIREMKSPDTQKLAYQLVNLICRISISEHFILSKTTTYQLIDLRKVKTATVQLSRNAYGTVRCQILFKGESTQSARLTLKIMLQDIDVMEQIYTSICMQLKRLKGELEPQAESLIRNIMRNQQGKYSITQEILRRS